MYTYYINIHILLPYIYLTIMYLFIREKYIDKHTERIHYYVVIIYELILLDSMRDIFVILMKWDVAENSRYLHRCIYEQAFCWKMCKYKTFTDYVKLWYIYI